MPKKSSKPKSPARKDILIRRFGETLGRDELLQTLNWTGDPRAMRVFEMLQDPVYSRHTLAKLCQRAGLRHADLLRLYHRKQLSGDDVRKQIDKVLKTSNNLSPEFRLKSLINSIHKELE